MAIDKMDELLLDLAKSQKESNRNMVKMFIVATVCFTVLLVTMIIAFIYYESQFETIDSKYTYEYDQEAEATDGGTAIVNGDGEVNYGTSKDTQESDN